MKNRYHTYALNQNPNKIKLSFTPPSVTGTTTSASAIQEPVVDTIKYDRTQIFVSV